MTTRGIGVIFVANIKACILLPPLPPPPPPPLHFSFSFGRRSLTKKSQITYK